MKNTNYNTLKTEVNNLEKKNSTATTSIPINQYNIDKQNLEKKIEDVGKKIRDTSGLLTKTILNTKTDGLVKKNRL